MKYATIIPLVGGMTTGNKQATGKNPELFLSYPDFSKNDAHAKLNFPDVPFIQIDSETNSITDDDKELLEKTGKIDFVSTVCPCAGLSSLNSSNRGADAPQNDWLYKSAEFVFENINPTVFWGENAPALGTKSGEPVANNLYKIGKEHGYSFTIVKTNTEYHGIPQKRTRTFYFFWKSDTAPLLNAYKNNAIPLNEYIDQVPEDALYMDEYPRNDFEKNGFLKWMYSDPKYLEMFKGNGKTVTHFARKNDLWDELIEYLEKNGFESELKFTRHAKKKVDSGKNYWDSSPYLLYGRTYIQAIQGRVYEHSIHHSNERYVSIREHMHLMGLPHDYQLTDIKHASNICQNVPVTTARDWTYEVMKFIEGKLDLTDKDNYTFNNLKEGNLKEEYEKYNTKSLF